MVMWHSCVVFWQRKVHTKINMCAECMALLHATSGVQSVAATCCNTAGCSKILHMDLNLRCLADSHQLQTSSYHAPGGAACGVLNKQDCWGMGFGGCSTHSGRPCMFGRLASTCMTDLLLL
jgi:hypothetical protein